MIEFSVKELKERIHGIYKRVGLSDEDADIMTEVLATTEIRGVFSHGFLRTRNYVKALLGGGMKKDADLTVLFDSPSWAMVDGNEALGIPTAYKATKIAIAKAKETGIGIVNVRGSHHCGAVGYYSAMCADEGLFGMCMSNGNPMVAPTGARSTGIGNNPFSYAAPAGKYGKVLYDVAFSAVSDMKILDLRDKGLPMPADWAIRKEDGQPTTDPNDYCKGKAVLTPIAGHKGYGLALMVEIMGAVMSGANILKNVVRQVELMDEAEVVLEAFELILTDTCRYDIGVGTEQDAVMVLDKEIVVRLAVTFFKIIAPAEEEAYRGVDVEVRELVEQLSQTVESEVHLMRTDDRDIGITAHEIL